MEATMTDLERLIAFLAKQPQPETLSLAERRSLYDRAESAFALPEGVTVEAREIDGVPCELVRVAAAIDGRRILYLHGGGYGIGSPRSHRHLAAAIGVAARADVLVPDYRLAPEHRFPAALDDALAAWRGLRAMEPHGRLAVMGDSAGGGLAVATLIAARDRGLVLPDAAVCLSPWVDLTCAPDSPVARAAAHDPLVKLDSITAFARAYLGSTPATDPLASPVFADLRGLPPLLIHAGRDEALASDATRLAEAARKAGVDATIELTDGVPHVWHWFWPRLDLGREAIKRIGAFIDRAFVRTTAAPVLRAS
jgi:monoterpene epsilon-lactone hydrolase